MEKIKKLWPTDLANVKITMPKEILIQQGNYIAELTKDLIVAEVKTDQGVLQGTNENVMVHRFVLKAPTMGNYSFNLLRAMHNLSTYPVTVWNGLTYEASLQTQPVISDEEVLKQLEEQSNLSEPEKPVILEEENKVDSLFKYLETIGVFPTDELINLRAEKGDEVTYEALTNDFELFIGKNDNESYIVMFNVVKHSQAGIFEIKKPIPRVKEKIDKLNNDRANA